MTRLLSKFILCLSALLTVAPADYCMLKVTGLCCHHSISAKSGKCCSSSPCCRAKATSNSETCSNCCDSPLGKHRACCSYTPANGLVTQAALVPVVDSYSDLPPPMLFDFPLESFALLESGLKQSTLLATHFHPQPSDAPLFLRDCTFLI